MTHAVGRITAAEARALVQEKRRREVEIDVVRHHGLVAQRIFEAARNGETELHYLFADIPTDTWPLLIQRLKEDGFEVHDDPMGGVVRWPSLRNHSNENEASERAEAPLLLPGAVAP
jgi:hypothetical protein